jgi:hypothetical protein
MVKKEQKKNTSKAEKKSNVEIVCDAEEPESETYQNQNSRLK